MVLCNLFWCQSFGDLSLCECSYYFSSVSVVEWPPFGEIATHIVDHMFSLYQFDHL